GFVEIADSQGLVLTSERIVAEAERTMVFSQLAPTDRFWNGVALLSLEEAPTSATIEFDSAAGSVLASTVVSLQKGQPFVKLSSELFPTTGNPTGGFLRITATSPIYGLMLFAPVDSSSGNFLSVVPAGLN